MKPFFEPEELGPQPEKSPDTLSLSETSIEGHEVTMSENDTIEKEKARKFVALLQGGSTPGEAAKAIGTSLRRITNDEDMRKSFEELMKTYAMGPEIRKMMVKAGLNKLFVESVFSNDIEDRKLALAVGKQISAEEGGPQEGTQIQINVDSIKDVITGVKLKGINDHADKEES